MTTMKDMQDKAMESYLLRLLLLGFLILVLQLPINAISDTIGDREQMRGTALRDVEASWGGAQVVTGPVLVVPYFERWLDDKQAHHLTQHYAFFQPDKLIVDGDIVTERRQRGIFEASLYLGSIKVTGAFKKPDFSQWAVLPRDALWDRAFVVVGVTEPSSLRDQVTLAWADRSIPFEPGTNNAGFTESGMTANGIFKGEPKDGLINFDFKLALAGSASFRVAPVGRDTEVTLRSPWPDPSFVGAYLPTQREVGPKGFTAKWKVPHLGRNYPQNWLDQEVKPGTLEQTAFGANFLTPAGPYQATERSVKYELLFVFMTFLGFFLVELFYKLRVHPVQYLLVGFTICLFYLLLLALSEHIGFDRAYALAAIAVVGVIGGYCSVILRSRKLGLAIGGELGVIYVFLYSLLQLQDYSLLVGSLGLFLVLAVVMYVTRKIDWYALGKAPTAYRSEIPSPR